MWYSSGRSTWVVAHDPIPIRRQAFSGRLSKKIAKRFGRVHWVSHTDDAAAATESELGIRPVVALHPTLSKPQVQPELPRTRKVVTVLGQFKPSRDLDVLGDLASTLDRQQYRLQIVGRGWPNVAGWEVTDRFVSETELDGLLAQSDVVVIPYRKYWQSGIAVRAVEQGAQVVGRKTEFLTRLVGEGYAGFVDMSQYNGWAEAVHRVTAKPQSRGHIHRRYRDAVDASWRPVLSHIIAQEPGRSSYGESK